MNKLNIKRDKNLWVPYVGNFCTPCAVWDVKFEQLEKIISIDTRKLITCFLLKSNKSYSETYLEIKNILVLTAIKLHSCDSDEIFDWLMEVNSKHTDQRFCYPFLDEKAAAILGPLSINFLLRVNTTCLNLSDSKVDISKLIIIFNSFKIKVDKVITSPSSLRVLVEAKKRLIPTRRHSDRPTYQLGYGANRRLIFSGYTDYTSQLATTIAMHKSLASTQLREAGIPTPQHFVVRSFDEAKSASEQLNFPVVVKPTSTDKGVGVTVGIKDTIELEIAWNHASKYGAVLVEQMLPGLDHRLHVINGKCQYVVCRTPPYILGDDVSTVEELVEVYAQMRSTNQEYINFPNASLDEAPVIEYLKKQGLSRNSILSKNQRVYLRSNANVSTGGFAEDVTKFCHLDNIHLAERAARIIGLDNAGIDLITTDIDKSWLHTGAGICDINSMPAFGKEISFKGFLDYLYPEGQYNKIKIILYVGNSDTMLNYHEKLLVKAPSIRTCNAFISDKKLFFYLKSGVSVFPGKTTQSLVNGMLTDPIVEFSSIQIKFNEINDGIDVHYLSYIVAVGNEFEVALLMKSNLITRCKSNNILINPSVPYFLESVVPSLSD